MAEDLSWVPSGVDTSKASIARVYDYWLGGSRNLQADRDAARVVLALQPHAREIARANRAFLARAVRFLAGAGIRQFLDIGSGIPTQGNVHEIAQQAAPGSRIVYVDLDPVAVAHSEALLAGCGGAVVIQADLRDPGQILASPAVRALLDFRQPVALLLAAVLHFVPDDEDPWRAVGLLRDALAPGSWLVLSHAASEGLSQAEQNALSRAYQGKVATRGGLRSRAAIERFFGGFQLAEPGLVPITQWRPGCPPEPATGQPAFTFLAGAGCKPALPG